VRRLGQKAGPVARWSELLRHCNAMLTAGLSSGQLPLLAVGNAVRTVTQGGRRYRHQRHAAL